MRMKRKGVDVDRAALVAVALAVCVTTARAAAADTRVLHITPRSGSLGGGTVITLFGENFAENRFNFGAGNEHLGSKVKLVSTTRSFECDIHPNGCHASQLECYTRAMPADWYWVRVEVDGEPVPLDQHCRSQTDSRCRFQPVAWSTPTIASLDPSSGPPDTVTTMSGRIMTSRVFSTQQESTNEREERIRRVYLGSENCEMRVDPLTDELYGVQLNNDGQSDSGTLRCRHAGRKIGNVNASIMLEGQWGRSLPDQAAYRVSARDNIYMFQTYPLIEDVSPAVGSVEGGTRLTITGKYFDQYVSSDVAQVQVGGAECGEVEVVSDTQLECSTPPVPPTQHTYLGHRGLLVQVWNGTDVYRGVEDMDEVLNYTADAHSHHFFPTDRLGFSEAGLELRDSGLQLEDLARYMDHTHGFFVPPHTGRYTFQLKSDDVALVRFSNSTGLPADKEAILSCPQYCPDLDTNPDTQITQPFQLHANTPYYIEAFHGDWVGNGWLAVGVKVHDTELNHAQADMVHNEVQRIDISSVQHREVQELTLSGYAEASDEAVGEEQQVTLTYSDGTDGNFSLTLQGARTAALSVDEEGEAVLEALNRMPGLPPHAVSSVTRAGRTFTVTFSAHLGDVGLLGVEASVGVTGGVAVSRQGVSDGSTLRLAIDGVQAAAIPSQPTQDQVAVALRDLFSVRCPADLAGSHADFDYLVKFLLDFEDEAWAEGADWGAHTHEHLPFCGRGSLRQPRFLFDESADDMTVVSLVLFPQMCFAYRGAIAGPLSVRMSWQLNGENQVATETLPVPFTRDDEWHFVCLDVLEFAMAARPGGSNYKLHWVRVEGAEEQSWVDTVIFARAAYTALMPQDRLPGVPQERLLPPMSGLMEAITVNETAAGQFRAEFTPYNCLSGLPLVTLPDTAQMTAGDWRGSNVTYQESGGAGTLTTRRLVTASPAVDGSFTLTAHNRTLTVDAETEEAALRDMLQTVGPLGSVQVRRYGDCTGRKYRVEWLSRGGDQPALQVDGGDLTGDEVEVEVRELQAGGVMHDSIPGDMLLSAHTQPQVTLVYEGMTARCDADDCSFAWSEDATPTVTGLSPATGTSDSVVTITGSGFGADAAAVSVMAGAVACSVDSVTDAQITCTPRVGPVGEAAVSVSIAPTGLAQHVGGAYTFTFEAEVSAISPTSAGIGGGATLTVHGYGFSENDTVKVNGTECIGQSASYTQITCTVPKINDPTDAGNSVPVLVEQDGGTLTSPTPLTYDDDLQILAAPDLLNVTTASVLGGTALTVTPGAEFMGGAVGAGLTASINGEEAGLEIGGDYLDITLPANPPGTYALVIMNNDTSHVYIEDGVLDISYVLNVTAAYPSQGSLMGGTRMTIRGEGFPTGSDEDVSVVIGADTSCDLESVDETEIICITDSSATEHQVDNRGVHASHGAGFAWEPANLEVGVGDSVRWWWSVPDAVQGVRMRVQQTVNATAAQPSPGGFSSGDTASAAGSFIHQFTSPGTYFYNSGQVLTDGDLVMKGTVVVTERSSVQEKVTVMVGVHEAMYELDYSEEFAPDADCAASTEARSNCTAEAVSADLEANDVSFVWSTCHTPVVTEVMPRDLNVTDDIMITGSGFSNESCRLSVLLGSTQCTVSAVTDSTITCSVSAHLHVPVYTPLPLSVSVENVGVALVSVDAPAARHVTLRPLWYRLSAALGSTAGGTEVEVTGAGFTTEEDAMRVYIGNSMADIVNVSTSSILFHTPAMAAGVYDVRVMTSVGDSSVPVECFADLCAFELSSNATPVVTNYTESALNADNEIEVSISITNIESSDALRRRRSVPDTGDVTVMVGDAECVVTAVTSSEITCVLTETPAGVHDVTVHVSSLGYASTDSGEPLSVDVPGTVVSVTPATGSINGGTVLAIAGTGFGEGVTAVRVGAEECALETVSFVQVTCVTGAGAAGAAEVVVTVSGQGLEGAAPQFTYDQAATPTVTAVQPTSVTGEATVTVTGTGLDAAQTSIQFGDAPCTSPAGSSTQLTCTFSPSASGTFTAHVLVHNLGLATVAPAAALQVTSQVDSLAPDQGSFGGGHAVVVAGSGFPESDAGSVTALLCGLQAEVSSVTATQISLLTPPHPGSGEVECELVVSISETNFSLPSAYTYRDSLTPALTSVTPRRAGTGGNTLLTLSVSNLGAESASATVSVEGVACDVTSNDGSTITCRTGASAVTAATHVRVSVGHGFSPETDDSAFEYIDVWSSRYTWGGEEPPVAGDMVVIREGQAVLLDADTPVLKVLLIQGGTLTFDPTRDVHLQAEYILVTNGGRFMVGSPEEAYEQQAVITLHGNLRAQELPEYGAKVLAVRDGHLGLHGKHIPHTWTLLAETAEAGSNIITLADPATGWNVGDLIVLPTTGDRHSQRESELFTITAVSADLHTLTLNASLQYTHLVVDTTASGHPVRMVGEVGLLSRNIKFRGTSDPDWNAEIEACPAGFDTGEFVTQTCFQGRFGDEIGSDGFGAIIFMHASARDQHLISAHIEYVELSYVGQEFRLGRYPIHFHLNGDMGGSYVRGVAIRQSFNRAVNVHGTHNLVIERNVIYNIKGGAFFFEDGIETGTTLQYNLAVFVISSTSLLNDDITPAAFWVTNPNNTVQHNHAAGGTHFGFWYRMHTHPDGPSFTEDICPKHVPLGRFFNNTVHSHGWFGLWIFQDFFPKVDGSCDSAAPSQQAVFERLHTWHCEKGAEWVDATDLAFTHHTCVDNEKACMEGKMIRASQRKYLPSGSVMSNAVIIAHHPDDPIYADKCTARGVIVPFDAGLILENVVFINFDQSGCVAIGVTSIDGKCVTGCGGHDYHLSGNEFITSPNKVAWRWEHEGAMIDVDGSLTGAAGQTVVPASGVLPSSCTAADAALGFNAGAVPSSICAPEVQFIRFAFNLASPPSLRYKDARFTVNGDSTRVTTAPFLAKRLTHKEGWMAMLPDRTSYTLDFVHAEQVTNISYTGTFYDLGPESYMVMKSQVDTPPDRIYVRRGDERAASESPLDFSNNVDGDWFFDTLNNKVSYLVSGRTSERRKRSGDEPAFDDLNDSGVEFQAYSCYYPDCVVPHITGDEIPAAERPEWAVLWSDPASWPDDTLPVSDQDLTIPAGRWIVADVERLPLLNNLYLYGTLEFEYARRPDTGAYYNFLLRATNIFIAKTGRLIAGWEDEPFNGTLDIELRGSLADAAFTYPDHADGPLIGSKAIAVFGGLDLHGNPAVGPSWTRLADTAAAGARAVQLESAVTWQAGDRVVIAATGYEARGTETRSITEREAGGTRLTVDALEHTHLGVEHTVPGRADDTYSMRAEVGLLSRNIRIRAPADDDTLESYGPRVLVSTMVYTDEAGDLVTATGYARLSHVAFYRCGQEGFTSEHDPRFALAFLSTGPVNDFRPSRVSSCSFDESYSPAVGVFGTDGLTVQDLVIYRTVGHAVQVGGSDTVLQRNLITMVLWPGSYDSRLESSNFDWSAGIDGSMATRLSLIDNVVAGSERSAYSVPGDTCSDDPEEQRMRGNVGHAVLTGVGVFPEYAAPDCLQLAGFYIYKAFDFGVYVQADANMRIKHALLVDNGVGVMGLPLKPPALSHQVVDKYIAISDSVIIGHSESFSCSDDVVDRSVPNIAFSGQARSVRVDGEGRVGVTWPLFLSGPNKAPRKPWKGAMSYPTLGGVMTVTDTHFASFTTNPCNAATRHYAVTTNPSSHDASHPVEVSGITWGDTEQDSKVFLDRPSLGQVDPSNCVDMSCDGQKKALLKDLDGSFLPAAAPGAVVPQSEYEWDGDPRHGLGDYRIPRAMLTDSSGQLLDIEAVYDHQGIIRNPACVYHAAWQAYECQTLQHEMLLIESMDADTETRRLSPVALRSRGDQRYLDLLNGPADHGWCDGYTCQQRISTFYALVAVSNGYDIFFTSTNPQHLRLQLLNTEPASNVHVAVYYNIPHQINVYSNQAHVPPIAESNTLPTLSDAAGTNVYDFETKLLHVILGGGSAVDIIIQPQIVVAFELPPMSVDEFFGPNLAQNLADFFGISADRIRVVEIVAEDGRRRRRDTESTLIEVNISPDTLDSLDEGNGRAAQRTELQSVSEQLVTAVQTETLADAVGLTFRSVSVEEPLPASDSGTWVDVASRLQDGEDLGVPIQVPTQLEVVQEPTSGTEGQGFDITPSLHMLDDDGARVTLLGSTASPWQLTAALVSESGSDPDAQLVGSHTVSFQNGLATFSELAISHSGSGYVVEVVVSRPEGVNFTARLRPVTVSARTLSGALLDGMVAVPVHDTIPLELHFVDPGTTDIAHDIFWKGHTWECGVEVNEEARYAGTLTGTASVTVTAEGTAVFTGLNGTAVGFVALTFTCTTTPASSYGFSVNTGVLQVTHTAEDVLLLAQRMREVQIKFNAQYATVVGDNEELFVAFIGNYLVTNHPAALYSNITLSEGSIVVSFLMEGPVATIDTTTGELWAAVRAGLTLRYAGYTLTAARYMVVNQQDYHQDGGHEDDDRADKKEAGMAVATLALVCVGVALLLLALIILIVFLCKKGKGKSERVTRVDVVNHVHVGSFVQPVVSGDGKQPVFLRLPSNSSCSSNQQPAIEYGPMQAEKQSGQLVDLYRTGSPAEQNNMTAIPPAGE